MLARIAPFAAVGVCVLAAPAVASSPPVGPLPAGPTAQITTQRGALIAIALPPQPSGRAWRLKGSIDTRIVREVSEANVGANVVVVFNATGKGSTTLSYGATRGETAKAYAAKRFHLTVR